MGEWNRTGPHAPLQLSGLTVGLVGYGHIGRLVARRLEGFDVELLVSDPALTESESPRPVELAELLARCDVVSLHCPLIDSTRHLIDQSALQLMRPHAVLVNTSRGEVVDEAALVNGAPGRRDRRGPRSTSSNRSHLAIRRCWACPTSSSVPMSVGSARRPSMR